MALICIVVPCYNCELYISRCIESILSQTLKNFEIIIINDGSDDDSARVCNEYANKYDMISVVHQAHLGPSYSRNVGIDYALSHSFEYITFVDGDDWVHPQYLEKLYDSLIYSKCSLSVCSFRKKESYDDSFLLSALHFDILDTEDFYCDYSTNAVVIWGKMFCVTDFSDIRLPVGKLHEDEMTTYKLLFKHSEISFIGEPLYYYFSNPHGIMRSIWNPKRLDLIEALEQNIIFFDSKHLHRAYNNRLLMIIESLCIYIETIYKLDNAEYISKHIPNLRKKLRKYIRICKKKKVDNAKSDSWAMSLAYPKLYESRLKCRVIIKKLFELKDSAY